MPADRRQVVRRMDGMDRRDGMETVHYASCTRIADLPPWPLETRRLPRETWEAGDYVVGRVLPYAGHPEQVEFASGRETPALAGDLIVGVFAHRAATLEAVGSFRDIGDDGFMHSMTEGGCMGRVTSRSAFASSQLPLRYEGHVILEGRKSVMDDWVPDPPEVEYDLPTVLVIGTSMSAGKTLTARVAVRELVQRGFRTVAAKVTGAGRYRDVLTMGDAGACRIFDFVDAGLPTTVCPSRKFRTALGGLLRRMADTGADVAVIEAGASPLEPYNGQTAVEILKPHARFTILCASDPYSVEGILPGLPVPVSLVAGPTANTEAGRTLVRELTGLPALNLLEAENYRPLGDLVAEAVAG